MDILAYIRVSSLDQKEKETNKTQEFKINEWAKYHKHNIIKWYPDLAMTGRAYFERPKFKELQEEMKYIGDGIVVLSISRISRDSQISLDFFNKIREANKQLFIIKENIDTTTSTGKAIFTILAAIGELDRDNIAEIAEFGRQKNIAEGKRIGGQIPLDLPIEEILRLMRDGDSPEMVAYKLKLINPKTEKPVSGSTIRRRLQELGLYDKYMKREFSKLLLEESTL